MKNSVKRIIAVLMALTVVSSIAVTAVNASPGNPEFMLALGDSITTGYGLENYDVDSTPYTCDSYANIVAEALGLKGGETYINKAVNGATSTDLLNLLPDLSNYLRYSDLVVVTIGGNDLLGAIPIVASAIAGKTVTSLEQSITVLQAATPTQFTALMNNSNFQTKMGAVLTKYATNISEIAKLIKQHAPNAHVIFFKQYNPMKNVPGFEDFGNFADTLIANINMSMETVCRASGFDIADAPSVINVDSAGLTNMLNYDIHPNAKGHVAIAKLLAQHIGITLDISGSTTTAPEQTTAQPEQTTKAPDETTKAPEETTNVSEETTSAPEVDTGNCEGDSTLDPEPAIKKGCFSSVSAGVVMIVSLFALAVVIKKN